MVRKITSSKVSLCNPKLKTVTEGYILKKLYRKEVKRYNKEFVEQDRAFGELGHPEGATINLDKVSHMITKLEEDGNNFVGRAKILSTPNGQIVKEFDR